MVVWVKGREVIFLTYFIYSCKKIGFVVQDFIANYTGGNMETVRES